MDTATIVLCCFVLISAFFTLLLVGNYEKKLKASHEAEAEEGIKRFISNGGIVIGDYTFLHFRQGVLWNKDELVPSSFNEMVDLIVEDVTQSREAGDFYIKARYSIYVDKENKYICFIIGRDSFDLSNVDMQNA